MASVSANGITIEYEEQGRGEPLVLLMGLGGQLVDWPQDFVDHLSDRGFRVIRHDNRDAGLSTEFTGDSLTVAQMARAALLGRVRNAAYSLSDMAADTAGLLDALGIEAAHIVGESMGGMIAQTLAIEHPHKVRSLTSIMANTGSLRHGRPTVRVLAKIARLPEPTRENAVEVGVMMWRLIAGPHFDEQEAIASGEASIARSFRPESVGRQTGALLAGGDRAKALGRIAVPTLVIHGLLDPLVHPSGGIATARAVPGSRLLMFPDMGHDLPKPRRAEIADAIAANAARAARATRLAAVD